MDSERLEIGYGVTEAELARTLQERAARATPAEHHEWIGGWWLRRSASVAPWLVAVLPHGNAEGTELERLVTVSETFHTDAGRRAMVQLTPGVFPVGLDAVLAARGYEPGPALSLRVADARIVSVRNPGGGGVEVADELTTEWFDVWHPVQGHSGVADAEWGLLSRASLPTGYACVREGGRVLGVGRAVVEDGWAGVFSMATLPAARGRGVAGAVLGALARWAIGHDAPRLYLQVLAENAAATRLYAASGFGELTPYRSHVAPE